MKFRTVQWNIGGAHIRKPEDDSSEASSYVNEDLPYVIDKLKSYAPDVITLQESHADDLGSQAKTISESLGLPYFVNDEYDVSHIDTSQKLSQSIISRFPITEHSFSMFFNPHYRKVWEDGTEWTSHDKGMSTVTIDINGVPLTVQTLHLIPFRRFDVDMDNEVGRNIISSIESLVENGKSPYLLQGDFNLTDVQEFLPNIFSEGVYELGGTVPTTPKGRIYDHVLARGLTQEANPVVDPNVLTDHYPVLCSFEI